MKIYCCETNCPNRIKGYAICTALEDVKDCLKRKAPKRVIAVRDANKEEINIFGYGEYVGEMPCPELCDIPNPKIVLDNGEVVWGYECWWGDAERFEKEVKQGRTINVVSK